MSKKNMESTRELMGTKEVTDYSVRTYRNDELVYFLIQPSNISVLSEESLSARIYGLMTVLKGITEIEMMCLNSRENFEDNKRYLKSYGGGNQPCGAKASGKGCKLLRPHAGADGYCKRVSVNYPSL